MSQLDAIIGVDQILIDDSYVLCFSRTDRSIVLEMDFTLASGGLGHMTNGHIIFPEVANEEWRRDTGERSSLEEINATAHRYSSGLDKDGVRERYDIGCINSVDRSGDVWIVLGDWGSCYLQTQSVPEVVLSREGSE